VAAVDRTLAEVQLDDPVIGGERFGDERLEYSGGQPHVAPATQRGVRHRPVQQALDVDPRAAGDETKQDPLKAQAVGGSGPVPAQRVLIDRTGSNGSSAAHTQHR
jgi:hypothetical protein